ncbi:transposase zinc-binding domain-containing protein [Ottowia sp.]|uniref:transposase zinc-binding domain-containing protein n=1 Tax=Ottowia sp. TaxID=1898956 RepID=UPI001D5665DF|nr:transposase zinc-binding domain-containing protein [Ottowia sp.]MBK9685634.1 transposase zinc-binding domain-containing protein [Betaproteobacteria bacterium]
MASRLHYERHRPEQTTLYRLVQQHAASFIAHTEASTDAELPRFIKDEFDAFLECGILAHGFLRLRCGECGHDKLLAFSCKRRGFCPSCGARRMSQTAAHLVDHVIPHVPVRQWVLSLPIRCACCWPRSRNWSRRCCRWCSAWSRDICCGRRGSRLTKVTAAPSR